jgi:hypothetical protein
MALQLCGIPDHIFRCFRGTDPLMLPPWDRLRQSTRGRWDDTGDEYRVLYCSSTKVGAFVEVLQDLRPDASTRAILDDIEGDDDRPEQSPVSVVADVLRNRRVSALLADQPEQRIVDVLAGASRSHIESAFGIGPTKIGDYIGYDRSLSRASSRLLFDENQRGLAAPSAEHDGSHTLAIFERHSTSGTLRVDLLPVETNLALTLGEEIKAAMSFLFGDVALATEDAD